MTRKIHPMAGKKADPTTLVTREEMESRYFQVEQDRIPVKNGTSGHRGVTGSGFSELHVAAMSQALATIRIQSPSAKTRSGRPLRSRSLVATARTWPEVVTTSEPSSVEIGFSSIGAVACTTSGRLNDSSRTNSAADARNKVPTTFAILWNRIVLIVVFSLLSLSRRVYPSRTYKGRAS